MSIVTLLVLLAVGVTTGALIGAVGVGGVLLVPALVLIGGLEVQEATPVATLSFLFTGVTGTFAYVSQKRIRWPAVRWLMVGAVPGAVAGAATNVALSATAITTTIAVMLGAGAVQSWVEPTENGQPARISLGAASLSVIGFAVGFGSTLSGTGGPVLLIPVMLMFGTAVGLAVSSSQPIQIPISVFGAVSFLAYGALDWQLAFGLGAAQGAGAIFGAHFSDRLPARTLHRLVTWALAASGVVFALKAVNG